MSEHVSAAVSGDRVAAASACATQISPAERLSTEAGLMAGRLARLLTGLAGGATAGESLTFLEAMATAAHTPTSIGTAFDQRRPRGATHPIDRLAEGLGLSPAEIDLIILAGLPDEHEGYASVLRSLHPRGEPRPSIGLTMQLLCEGPGERFALRQVLTSGAAVRSGALQLGGDGPFLERSLLLAEELWSALMGLDAWPAGLEPLPVAARAQGLDEWLASEPAPRARAALRSHEPRLILVLAEREEAALHRAVALAEAAGVSAVALAVPPGSSQTAEKTAGLHALARGVTPVLRLPPADGPAAVPVPELHGFPGPVIVATRQGVSLARCERPVLAVPCERLSSNARRRLWARLLPELEREAPILAARYSLEPSVAIDVAHDVRSLAALDSGQIDLAQVAESVRLRGNVTLSAGVKLIRPWAKWEHLVVPDDTKLQLREALGRLLQQARVLEEWGFLRNRPGARGVRLLFVGPPGTGKTLSAEVLAGELGADLLVVDISRVVSKWIGETEKNLAEVFDAAERSQAVLLFDEADALYGKRTEVSDAHDRYANLETAYLLSRLERFDGLAILASNLRQNIDPAFMRRLEFVVEFHEPTVAEREALWRAHLPKDAPLAPDVDVAELSALYPIVGALIRNATAAAAFLAAGEGADITRRHLVRAVRREYQKAGRAFPGPPPGLAQTKEVFTWPTQY